jgi:type II secretory pathway predicted ATPase ExeA
MLRDIIEGIVRPEADIEVIDDCEADLSVSVRQLAPDVVLVGEGPAGPLYPARLLLLDPRITVIVISADGRRAELLGLHRRIVAELSIVRLVDEIRGARQHGGANPGSAGGH